MKDERKFRLTAILLSALCILAMAYNIVSEYFLPDISGYIKRRIYYESVISKKGLSMRKAEHWRKKDDIVEEKPAPADANRINDPG